MGFIAGTGRKGFENILVFYDDSLGSNDVLQHAVTLASACEARLTMVSPLRRDAQPAEAARDARNRLRLVVPWIARQGVGEVATDVLVGPPAGAIVRLVLRESYDLVVVNAEGGRTFVDAIVGNTARILLRTCPCPVWLVRPGRAVPHPRVLAAVDARAHEPTRVALNARILDCAMSVSQALGASLDVVHAWEVEGTERDMLRSEITEDTRLAILARHEAVARIAVNGLLARYAGKGPEPAIHLPRGTAPRRIADLARHLDVNLVVMGSAGRVGLQRLLLGNAAETVQEWVRSGVLVVKPEGFRTPIAHPEEAMPDGRVRASAPRRPDIAVPPTPERAKEAERKSR